MKIYPHFCLVNICTVLPNLSDSENSLYTLIFFFKLRIIGLSTLKSFIS